MATDYLQEVKTGSNNFHQYKNLTPEIYNKSVNLAHKIEGRKIFHFNSTRLYGGGGVSELLHSQVPLEKSLGLDSHWFIIKAPAKFFGITKKIHNLLQGELGVLTDSEKRLYLEWVNNKIAPSFKKVIGKERPDIVIIHDPQPLPLINNIPKDIVPILRLHIDLSEPNPTVLKFFQPLIKKYKTVILTHSIYRPIWLAKEKTKISQPAINPFSDKNRTMKKSEAKKILSRYKINTEKPIISQVGRFDPWKDPMGTYQAYCLAKNKIPNLQLIMPGFRFAKDDPQAQEIYRELKKQIKNDKDVFLFFYPEQLKGLSNDLFINAVYTASKIVLQKSLKEGFGLTVTEAMWKGKPVIGGMAKGIALQIKHGENGLLVSSPEQAAEYIIHLLEDRSLRKELGKAAQKTVKDNFLLSRLVLDHLRVYSQL